MKTKKSKELIDIEKEINIKQNELDDIIVEFNRNNTEDGELLIKKYRGEIKKLNIKKYEIEQKDNTTYDLVQV